MGYSKRDAVSRAGVATEFLDRLLTLGLVVADQDGRFTSGDVRRISLMLTLEQAGIPLEGVATAVDKGQLALTFLDDEGYDRFSAVLETTFAELSESLGVPVELLLTIREAIGYAEPTPEDRIRDNELLIAPLVQAQVELGYRPATIERWLRVYGEAFQRIAETEAEAWRTDVEMPLIESGMSPAAMMEHADAHVMPRLAPLLEDVLLGLYHGHQEHAWTSSIMIGVEAELREAGIFSRMEHPPAICFLDLTGYTRLTEEHGDETAADIANRLNRVVRRSSAQHTGRPIKWLGDGVMFYFREPGRGILSALEMVAESQAAGLPPAHVGLHTGPVLFQEGDYFGRTVNIAARIADYARPGEVLVSHEVVNAADQARVSFTEIGPVDLKGIADPVRLYSARHS